MKATIIEDAPVLLPNKKLKNFSHVREQGTGKTEVIPKGAEVDGQIRIINGMRAGKPFDYKMFFVNQVNGVATDRGKIIFLNKIQPMNTEVNFGADSARSATRVDLPSQSNLGWKPIVCTLIGGGIAYYYAKKKGKHKTGHAIFGGVVGFIAGKYWQSKSAVVIKPSK